VGGSWGENEVNTRSSKGSNHCCCSTNRPHIEWSSRSYTHILSIKCLVMLTFQPDIVLVRFLEISCHIPSITFYSYELNKGELLSKILLYELEHITKTGGKCAIMISFSQPGFMGSKAKWNATVGDNEDGYKRPSFHRRSLLPSIFSTILCFIRNNQLNWLFDYCHLLFTYDVDEWISAEDNQYGSNQWAVWLTTMPRRQCGSVR